jgi:ubiquinone/menaquinone biosynthesis C-methylase UbiE
VRYKEKGFEDQGMSQVKKSGTQSRVNHPIFSALYEVLFRGLAESHFMGPLRQHTAGKSSGTVLEIGAGNGMNFPYYDPARVERVEATEPDAAMLRYARNHLKQARVPVHLTQALAENLPFANATFDSAVITLVFCSVEDPLRGFREVRRVLKPDGTLYLLEHVRSRHAFLAGIQTAMTPISRAVNGNCRWNRDTAHTLLAAGFEIVSRRDFYVLLIPMLLAEATRG